MQQYHQNNRKAGTKQTKYTKPLLFFLNNTSNLQKSTKLAHNHLKTLFKGILHNHKTKNKGEQNCILKNSIQLFKILLEAHNHFSN